MKSTKAQMKIQQTAFMLIALTLFFVLVGLFVLGFTLSDLKRDASALEEKDTMLLVTKLANSPEFACGDSFGPGKINCVDADKIMMLQQDSSKYSEFWKDTNISIIKIYPITPKVKCTSLTYPNCNEIEVYSKAKQGISIGNYVSLCRKEIEEGRSYDKCELAMLMVSYEKKS
ncbi:MAG: hypothetical protein ABIH59_01240 [archaeon]